MDATPKVLSIRTWFEYDQDADGDYYSEAEIAERYATGWTPEEVEQYTREDRQCRVEFESGERYYVIICVEARLGFEVEGKVYSRTEFSCIGGCEVGPNDDLAQKAEYHLEVANECYDEIKFAESSITDWPEIAGEVEYA